MKRISQGHEGREKDTTSVSKLALCGGVLPMVAGLNFFGYEGFEFTA